MTEILSRAEASGATTIARYEVTLGESYGRWSREDKEGLRRFLRSCFQAEKLHAGAQANADDAHERKFAVHEKDGQMDVVMSRRVSTRSIWRGFWRATIQEVEATTV